MTRRILARINTPCAFAGIALAFPLSATAHDNHFKGDLDSFQEVPALWSAADGKFTAKLNKGGTPIAHELRYDGLESDATQAHIHFGQGISAGQFDKLVEALREGLAYANVHTTGYPGGEIRGQLK